MGPRVRRKRITQAVLGMNGETHVAMVSDLAKDGESVEDHPHGVAAGGNRGYWGSERARLFWSNRDSGWQQFLSYALGNLLATDINGVINLKKWKMIFEKKSLHVIVPLNLAEGLHYTELVHDYESDDDLDCIYNIIAWDQD